MCREVKGAEGSASGDVLGCLPSGMQQELRPVAQSTLAAELEGGDKDDAVQEVSREQQCFHDGTVLPAGRD